MIWIALAALGVPLWLCAVAIVVTIVRTRRLRARPGNLPARVRQPSGRWRRGNAVWVHDTFAFRGSPAAWSEHLVWVVGASARPVAAGDEAKRLRRLGEGAVVAVLACEDGTTLEVAAAEEHAVDLLGPFAADVVSTGPPGADRPDLT